MKIRVKSWRDLSIIGDFNIDDIEIGDTRFVFEMKKFCEQIIEVMSYEPWDVDDYDCQTLDGEWLFAPWMYEKINQMNRNGANK